MVTARYNALRVCAALNCGHQPQGKMGSGKEQNNAAEEIIGRFIWEGMACDDENDVVFTAAEKLYEKTGDKKKLK